jgi:hypothetical protein
MAASLKRKPSNTRVPSALLKELIEHEGELRTGPPHATGVLRLALDLQNARLEIGQLRRSMGKILVLTQAYNVTVDRLTFSFGEIIRVANAALSAKQIVCALREWLLKLAYIIRQLNRINRSLLEISIETDHGTPHE